MATFQKIAHWKISVSAKQEWWHS